MIKKIILFINGIETQGYFSIQMGRTFEAMSIQTFYYDYWEEEVCFRKLQNFIEPGVTVMLTFNFHGLEDGEKFYGKDGTIFWDKYRIPCFNIVVDHPLYYQKFLTKLPKKYYQISIDRYHEKYMKRYWENISLAPFLPLAGTRLHPEKPLLSMKDRPIDIVMTGNYTPPETFRKYIERIDEEYTAFYMGMIRDLQEHPEKTIEQVAEKHIKHEIPEVTKEELRETIGNLSFIDLYVRFWLRGEVIRQLVDSGLKVHTCGKGWDALACAHPENIIEHGGMDSEGCLEMLSQSKLSVNVMPWFKDGAHDRIFNSQLNGAVCISDDSIYLREIFTDGKDILFYGQNETGKVPEMVKELLADEEKIQQIADNGYKTAADGHTWEEYAKVLLAFMEKVC